MRPENRLQPRHFGGIEPGPGRVIRHQPNDT
jgi:hypothetical protein